MLLRQPFKSVWSPWQEMERLRREMNRLLANAPARPEWRAATGYPTMNVWTNVDGAIVTAELPGVNPEDIDISVLGDTLTVTGSRQPEELQEGETYHRQERAYGKFSRSFQLPFQVAPDKVEATLERGILRIALPRAEEDKPRKIAVKAG